MLKKLQRNLERKKDGKTPVKFRFDVQIKELRGVPGNVDHCRVVWSRGAKVQMTDLALVTEGNGMKNWKYGGTKWHLQRIYKLCKV